MSDTIADRVRHYALDGRDADLRRLVGVSHVSAEMARSAFRRIGVREGWKAIECGCGPIGGLAVIATDDRELTVVNLVGPVNLDKLAKLEGQFGVPELGIEKAKPKNDQ